MKLTWWPWRREEPERTEDDSGLTTWSWTGPTNEGPPMIGIGKTRWEAEQAIVDCVERFHTILGKGYQNAEEGAVGLIELLEWARRLKLATADDVETWRAALQIRSTILADDEHTVPMDILRVRAAAVNDMCERVQERIEQYLDHPAP